MIKQKIVNRGIVAKQAVTAFDSAFLPGYSCAKLQQIVHQGPMKYRGLIMVTPYHLSWSVHVNYFLNHLFRKEQDADFADCCKLSRKIE